MKERGKMVKRARLEKRERKEVMVENKRMWVEKKEWRLAKKEERWRKMGEE